MRKRSRKKPLKAIDFFCGTGGMTYGVSQLGIRVIAGIDIDPDCRDTYEMNNPGSKFIEADIHDLSEEDLANRTGITRNDDALIFIACSPCQYWTKINTDKKKSERTKELLKEFQRFVSWFKPGYIMMENVPGLYSNTGRNVLGPFLDFLDSKSYAYADDVINANHYGVPQKRRRFVMLATRLSDAISLPEPILDDTLTVRNFIGEHNGFPPIDAGHKDRTDFIHTSMQLSELNRMRLQQTPINGGTRLSWKDDPELQLRAYHGKDSNFRDVYSRMYWDRPAPTITTRFPSISNGRFGHPEELRGISLREGATLQTFPKSYVFKGPNESSIARQIGNAVPPELAKRMGSAIKVHFENVN